MLYSKIFFFSLMIATLSGCLSTTSSTQFTYDESCSPYNNSITNMIRSIEDRAIVAHSTKLIGFLESNRYRMKEEFEKKLPRVYFDKIDGIDNIVNNMRLFRKTYYRFAYSIDSYCSEKQREWYDFSIKTQYREFETYVKFESVVTTKHGNTVVLETKVKRRKEEQRF